MDWSRLFPVCDREYSGPMGAYYFLILVAVISTVRSLPSSSHSFRQNVTTFEKVIALCLILR